MPEERHCISVTATDSHCIEGGRNSASRPFFACGDSELSPVSGANIALYLSIYPAAAAAGGKAGKERQKGKANGASSEYRVSATAAILI